MDSESEAAGFDFVQGTVVPDMNFSSQREIDDCVDRFRTHQQKLQDRLEKTDHNSCIGLYLYKKKDRKQMREKILEIDEKIEELLQANKRIDFVAVDMKNKRLRLEFDKEEEEWRCTKKRDELEYNRKNFDKTFALTLVGEIDNKIAAILKKKDPDSWGNRNEISSLEEQRKIILSRIAKYYIQ